jgi:hypothetical protein
MTDLVSRVHSFCELAVDKLGDEVGDIKADFQMVDSAVKKLGDEIGKIKETDLSEIFKELAWREERSRELLLNRGEIYHMALEICRQSLFRAI